MRKRISFIVIITITISLDISGQKIQNLPTMRERQIFYDSTRDDKNIDDPGIVITAKQFLSFCLDSLEKMFKLRFNSIPYVKFGLPDDIQENSPLFQSSAAYRAKEKSIYFALAINHLKAVRLGTANRSSYSKARGKAFEKDAVHELAHFIHDLFLRRLISKMLDPEDLCSGSQNSAIEYQAIVEGFAEWVESRYTKDSIVYMNPDLFPKSLPDLLFDKWREYGFNFVGPILDINPKKGLEYLILHPFKIHKDFRESAKKYQKEALFALKTKE